MRKKDLKKPELFGIVLSVVAFTIVIVLILIDTNSNKFTTTVTEETESTTRTSTTESKPNYYGGIPYKHMPESQVEYTSLGKADEVKKCTNFYERSHRDRWKKYYWKKNGTIIFIVTISYYDYHTRRSTPGYVLDITDWRDSANYNYKATTKKHTTAKDPYNAKDYYNEDDFYEDHYDDFYDFDDAEEYYYDNY
ncbi:MAG: hypothetical protein K6F09_00375 [Clostridiales bacterium]|nr:hypothetical protein [Clostridiales bacterium]